MRARSSSIVPIPLSSLLILVAAGCSSAPANNVRETEAAISGARPLVTLLMGMPGPTAPASQQWTNKTTPVNVAIPDNLTPGVDTDVTVDAAGGVCSQMYSIQVDLGITHPRLSDLYITASAVSRDGSAVLKTLTLFDGPSLGRAGTTPSAMAAALSGDLDVSLLTQASDCGRLRINVADWAPTQTGTLDSVTVKVRTAWYPFAHDRTWYAGRLFGPGFPNVADFYREESRGAFTFSNAGVYGPVPWGNWHVGETDGEHVADVIAWLDALGFDFNAYDTNHDGVVDNDELEIVEVENSNDVGGANRSGGCVSVRHSAVQVCTNVAFVSEETDFATLAHEMSHSLGTVDLYGTWNKECWSGNMTLMSCTISSDDNPASWYHDPWHRIRLGWSSRILPGCAPYTLGDESYVGPSGYKTAPVMYRNPKNQNEYYLFEYRRPNGYDLNVADTGVVAWHVSENADGSPYQGADGKQPFGHFIYALSPGKNGTTTQGGSLAWKPSNGTFNLTWLDGTPLGYNFSVTEPGNATNNATLNCWGANPTDFDFSVTPQQTSLAANDTESLTLDTRIGTCSPVQFSIAAAPPGVYAAVSSPTVSSSGSSYLYLGVNAGTAPESGLVTVAGSCGGSTHTYSVQLTTTPCVPTTCAVDSCGTISDGCGGQLSCGGCAAGLVCQGGTCQTPTPACKTPRQCCLQSGGYWINNHCE